MSDTVTNAQVITVLKHLAAGRQPDFVAQVTHLPQRLVEDIAEKHGWPDPEPVRRGIFDLTRAEQGATTATPTAPAPRPTHLAPPASSTTRRHDLSVARTAPPAAPTVVERPRTVSSSAAELIHMASESHKAGTRNLGKRISGLLADLSQRLNDEETERLARIAADQEKAKKAKRIAELQAELARLKGKPAPKAAAAPAKTDTPAPGGEPTAAQIRTWAADKGIDCPAFGRVPTAVREAYDNAHSTDAA